MLPRLLTQSRAPARRRAQLQELQKPFTAMSDAPRGHCSAEFLLRAFGSNREGIE